MHARSADNACMGSTTTTRRHDMLAMYDKAAPIEDRIRDLNACYERALITEREYIIIATTICAGDDDLGADRNLNDERDWVRADAHPIMHFRIPHLHHDNTLTVEDMDVNPGTHE